MSSLLLEAKHNCMYARVSDRGGIRKEGKESKTSSTVRTEYLLLMDTAH